MDSEEEGLSLTAFLEDLGVEDISLETPVYTALGCTVNHRL